MSTLAKMSAMENDRQWLARVGAMAAVLFAGHALTPLGSPDLRHGQQMQIRIDALPLAEGAPANAANDEALVKLQRADCPGSGTSEPGEHRMLSPPERPKSPERSKQKLHR